MEGFDMIILNSLYVLPSFQRQFGTLNSRGSYVIPAKSQMMLSNLTLVGQILGLLLSGYVVEKIGYKYTLIAGLVVLAGTIAAPFCAKNMLTLAIGQILCGVPWGVFQTTTTTYASEVTPLQLRPFLTTYVNFCWCLGQLISSLVVKHVAKLPGSLPYKVPFASQWIWIVPVISAIFFAPESPWWLIRQGRMEDARRHLMRLTTRHYSDHSNTKAAVNMMFYTNELEKSQSGGIDYLDCFKGTDLRRTEISCNVWAIQIVSGGSLMGYSAYFYQRAGLSTSNAFSFQAAQFALGMLGTMFSWFLMRRFGRRTLYLFGQAAGLILLLGMGISSIFLRGSTSGWTAGSLLLAFTFVYDATVGPVCYTLVAEVSSTRLRNKTIVLARIWYNILGIAAGSLTPQMLNPDAWNWAGKAAFVYAFTALIMLVWTYYRLPETKDRSFTELDVLFDDKVRARDFDLASAHLASNSDPATSRGGISLPTRRTENNSSHVQSIKGPGKTKFEDGEVRVEQVVTVVSERQEGRASTEVLIDKK
ncbi:general substrate transporter [Myriangium duriaei CBS 260.36]|uniref:General substrate transporter n=1 Tax=Myriangium duriaei CBS 260.36 TaxID=1168546 RepID=A0A9P4MD82_9PEZI|nr:general substrate transporter [Myriangium duriaei CBS 260.36]